MARPARERSTGGVAAMPETLRPMLATAAKTPPRGRGWASEPKWDGIRALVWTDREGVRVRSRRGHDVTHRWPELDGLPQALGRRAILDGEIVTLDAAGRPSFERLQGRMNLEDPGRVARARAQVPAFYLVFDLLWLDDDALWPRPWRERRGALEALDLAGPHWRCSPTVLDDYPAMAAAARAQGLEGVVLKRVDAPYEPGRRTRSWLKIKDTRRQELVVGGWLPGEGGRGGRIGALVVGYYEGDRLRLAGKVGTGFTEDMLDALGRRLAPLERETSAFADPVPWPGAVFVEPALVAEIEFLEWTARGLLRAPSFKGLRDDKDPREVVRED